MAIAEKDGYQISGGPLLINQPEVLITLFRTDKPIPPADAIRPVLDEETRHAAAKHLLAGMLETRRSIGTPRIASLIRPSCGRRRSAMFRRAMILTRDTKAARNRAGGGSISIKTPSTR